MNLRLVKWAALECEKQRSGERSVWHMLEAWNHARVYQKARPRPSYADIVRIGQLVEPSKNMQGLRTVNVRVGFDAKEDWHTVSRTLNHLTSWEAYRALDADEWYRQFEECHPFLDGNGRVGNILWNWIKGTLDPDRVAYPPDYWGGPDMNEVFDSIE